LDFEERRLEFLTFLDERARQIPPIANIINQLEISQENLFEALSRERTEPAAHGIRLMGGNYAHPVTEAELISRLEILAEQLEIQRLLYENLESYRLRMGEYLLNYPTLMPITGGTVTSGFGWRRDPINGGNAFHEGVDIPAPSGTPILAAGGGTVIYSGWRGGYGNVVFLCHGGGITTRYAHNSQNNVEVGERVERGQAIAYVGSTGRSISTHLHYEVLIDGQHVDPMIFITER
jgi:murein DD-endopeptidase MepM/ murein hydrolase activator NlpD